MDPNHYVLFIDIIIYKLHGELDSDMSKPTNIIVMGHFICHSY